MVLHERIITVRAPLPRLRAGQQPQLSLRKVQAVPNNDPYVNFDISKFRYFRNTLSQEEESACIELQCSVHASVLSTIAPSLQKCFLLLEKGCFENIEISKYRNFDSSLLIPYSSSRRRIEIVRISLYPPADWSCKGYNQWAKPPTRDTTISLLLLEEEDRNSS